MIEWRPRRELRSRATTGALLLALGLSLGALPGRGAPGVGEGPAVGRLLVASRDLLDPNFRHTVVLLVEHGERQGAMGVVLNRPSEVEVGTFLPEIPGLEERHDPVFVGGPVEPFRAVLLVRAPDAPEQSTPVLGDLHFSASRSLLERLAGEPRPDEVFRVYSGYAGWAAGQLEAEIAVGGWHVVRAAGDQIFDLPTERLWQELLLRGTAEWAAVDGPGAPTPAG